MKKVFPIDNVNLSISNVSTCDAHDPNLPQICRFCRQTSVPEYPALIFPCHCPEPIHPPCLLDEMERVRRGQILESGPNKKFNCCKCAQTIRFKAETTLRCRSPSEMLSSGRSNGCMCTWLTLGTILMLALLVLLVVLRATDYPFASSVVSVATTIGLAIVIGVLFLMVSYFFVAELMIHRDVSVTLVVSEKQRRKNSSRLEIINCE